MKPALAAISIAALPWVGASGVDLFDDFGIETHGFADVRGGIRYREDANQDDASLGEARLQLDLLRYGDFTTIQVRSDVVADGVADDNDIDLNSGAGWIDLREAYIQGTPHDILDIKAGRQILTWGTGDLLFLNDAFPKDWPSFFIGRDEEYLKAPSDAVMVSLFPTWANIDLAYTPQFDADRYIRGERISFFNPALGRIAGQDAPLAVQQPDEWFQDDEIAGRLSRTVGSYEIAAYGYVGHWKSPGGFDAESGQATFPRLNIYGASTRGQALDGIINAEIGYYDSREDRDGDNPLVNNSEFRGLAGFQRELGTDLTGGVQYYVEHMLDHDAYAETLPPESASRDENRHLLTIRLTQQLLNQNLTLSLFGYASPSDEDLYIRPTMRYKVSDEILVTAGANIFEGNHEETFFGQFVDASNVYAGLRYSF